MKVLIVHYHLNPGGVTRIIEAQINGLKTIGNIPEMIVLCGDANELQNIGGVPVKADRSLYYQDNDRNIVEVEKTVDTIVNFLKGDLTRDSILHFHNPNLGKNPCLTMAVYRMASEGHAVINHCHDFPEDRPVNLNRLARTIPGVSNMALQQVLYPAFPRYHFIVLNSCDHERILQQGISPARVHLLPNPVSIHGKNNPIERQILKREICRILEFDGSKKLCTYPVRAIERKNLGEFILFAALFADVANFAVTQPPRNPLELGQYQRWKAFCNENGIAMKFEAGNLINHEELINISDFCITTSVQEGFGMVYLEPWMVGTPVIGRRLNCIIGDLINLGVKFPRLYDGIMVDANDKRVDFKDLMQAEKERVIKAVISDGHARRKLFRDNPFLVNLFDDIPDEIIQGNRQIIKQRFSIEEYGKEIQAIYKGVSRGIG